MGKFLGKTTLITSANEQPICDAEFMKNTPFGAFWKKLLKLNYPQALVVKCAWRK